MLQTFPGGFCVSWSKLGRLSGVACQCQPAKHLDLIYKTVCKGLKIIYCLPFIPPQFSSSFWGSYLQKGCLRPKRMLLPPLRSRNIFTIPNATKSTTTTTTTNPGCCLLSIAAQFICLLAATVGSYTRKKKVILNCLQKIPPQIEGQRKCPDKRLHCARAQSKHVSEMEEYWRVYLTTSNPLSHPPCTQVQHDPARCSSSTLRSRSNADNVNTSLPQYTHTATQPRWRKMM